MTQRVRDLAARNATLEMAVAQREELLRGTFTRAETVPAGCRAEAHTCARVYMRYCGTVEGATVVEPYLHAAHHVDNLRNFIAELTDSTQVRRLTVRTHERSLAQGTALKQMSQDAALWACWLSSGTSRGPTSTPKRAWWSRVTAGGKSARRCARHTCKESLQHRCAKHATTATTDADKAQVNEQRREPVEQNAVFGNRIGFRVYHSFQNKVQNNSGQFGFVFRVVLTLPKPMWYFSGFATPAGGSLGCTSRTGVALTHFAFRNMKTHTFGPSGGAKEVVPEASTEEKHKNKLPFKKHCRPVNPLNRRTKNVVPGVSRGLTKIWFCRFGTAGRFK